MPPLIVDAHLDLAMSALEYNRDLTLEVTEIRRREQAAFARGLTNHGGGTCTVSLPAMRRAGVGLCGATLYARVGEAQGELHGWASPGHALAAVRGQMAYYETLAAQGHVRFIRSSHELTAHVEQWTGAVFSSAPPPVGVILTMECADPLLKEEEVEEWAAVGVRAVGPAHYGANVYAHGTGARGGLTGPGRTLLAHMARLGLVLDVSHLADAAFWEALEMFPGAVMASHSNCRALAPGERQLSDDQLKALLERGAVIGLALEIGMLGAGGTGGKATGRGVTRETVSIHRLMMHIDHICNLAGNTRQVGLGTDLDGGFGRERIPRELDSIADLTFLAHGLRSRGFAEDDVAGMLGGNWISFWRENLKTAL